MEKELQQSLERLETSLETPNLPGELPSWSKSVNESLRALTPKLEHQLNEVYPDQLQEIGRQDPGLLTRVETLRAEGTRIAKELSQLTDRVELLAEKASQVEPDESQLQGDIADVIDQGLSFVLDVRKQEIAIATWLSEAFRRDRGIAD